MSDWKKAADIQSKLRERGYSSDDRKALLKKLPSAVRRMGLIRCIEWLSTGKHASLGEALFAEIAADLGLDLDLKIPQAVRHLEECERTKLLRAHRRTLTLFDRIATIQRIEE